MKLVVPALRSAALLLGSGLAFAQLSSPPQTPSAAGAPAPASATAPAGHTAQVAYSYGQLEVSADNSSLNQILHEIARVTGMKITGSVADARVFGKYGPDAPTNILKSLLDGTGVNMLLKETASGAPAELILTPRNGPATPPNPAAAQVAQDVPAPAPPARVGDPGTEGVVVLDINGNPAPIGSPIPPAEPLPPTQEQRQQHLQQMRQVQQQQAMQLQQQAGQH